MKKETKSIYVMCFGDEFLMYAPYASGLWRVYFSAIGMLFSDINVLQGSVVTYLRCVRIFIDCFMVIFVIGQYLMKIWTVVGISVFCHIM